MFHGWGCYPILLEPWNLFTFQHGRGGEMGDPSGSMLKYLIHSYPGLNHTGKGGGGGRRTSEKVRGALVHKRGRKHQHDWLYIRSVNSIKRQQRQHLEFGTFIVTLSMIPTIQGGIKVSTTTIIPPKDGSPGAESPPRPGSDSSPSLPCRRPW